ncbi:hypothetical protein DDI_3523 [Dickeya dianthicola RNS04.9]|nr:hypothetical protein DDI_3523 [Dickeya dianthicola RNS04.9]
MFLAISMSIRHWLPDFFLSASQNSDLVMPALSASLTIQITEKKQCFIFG